MVLFCYTSILIAIVIFLSIHKCNNFKGDQFYWAYYRAIKLINTFHNVPKNELVVWNITFTTLHNIFIWFDNIFEAQR